MILRDTQNKFSRLEYEGDNFKVFHAERVNDDALKGNYELRKDKANCWSADKEMRMIARVPLIAYIRWMREYPELHDADPAYRDRFLYKLLRKEENQVFKTVENI